MKILTVFMQPVEQFEKDFANGYLLGELLFKFN
jgi:hypothetical protein